MHLEAMQCQVILARDCQFTPPPPTQTERGDVRFMPGPGIELAVRRLSQESFGTQLFQEERPNVFEANLRPKPGWIKTVLNLQRRKGN